MREKIISYEEFKSKSKKLFKEELIDEAYEIYKRYFYSCKRLDELYGVIKQRDEVISKLCSELNLKQRNVIYIEKI